MFNFNLEILLSIERENVRHIIAKYSYMVTKNKNCNKIINLKINIKQNEK